MQLFLSIVEGGGGGMAVVEAEFSKAKYQNL